jgi:hypothetical protein
MNKISPSVPLAAEIRQAVTIAAIKADVGAARALKWTPADACSTGLFELAALGDGARVVTRDGHATEAAAPETVNVEDKQALVLADIETRLTEEVRRLILALTEFGHRTQAIGEEIPVDAEFVQLVTCLLSLMGFQFAVALGQGLDKPILFDDGCEYLRKHLLTVNDLFGKIDLDGRSYLAVALVDEPFSQVMD